MREIHVCMMYKNPRIYVQYMAPNLSVITIERSKNRDKYMVPELLVLASVPREEKAVT